MVQPTTQYAMAGEVNIAYQVVGDGPVDLVWVYGIGSNIEVFWEEPSLAAFFRRLSEFSRLILFDRRGCGASDREGATVTPTLEERMEDVLAVLDAAGSERAAIFGISEGGSLAAALAAHHPDRVRSIILYGTAARFQKDADHPWGMWDTDAMADFFAGWQQLWGTLEGAAWALHLWAPSMVGDERFTAWLAKYARQSVSRSAILPLMWSSSYAYDLVDVFPAVRVPALVLHRSDDLLIPIGQGRRIAEQVPDGRFVELPGIDHLPFVGDAESVLAEIEGFLVGSRTASFRHRRLLTILYTEVATSAGEANLTHDAWRELNAAHEQVVRVHLARFGGEEVKDRGDGVLAVFDGPARAVRCALGIVDASERLGLEVRAGVHTGECDVVDTDVAGIAVDIASGIAGSAAPGQILESSTVYDLVPGSGIRFGERRNLEVEGIAGPRMAFPVLRHGASPDTVRRFVNDQANVLRRDGEYWTIGYQGLVVTLRDSKGLRDIARLVIAPDHEMHVLDLAAEGAADAPLASRAEVRDADLHLDTLAGEPLLDDTARTAYKRRITELKSEITKADDRGDSVASAAAREELDALVEHLTAAYGLAGRPRRAADHVERARKAVTRRVRDAMHRIDRAHPALGRHMNASIRTGTFCVYAPERDITWNVEAGLS